MLLLMEHMRIKNSKIHALGEDEGGEGDGFEYEFDGQNQRKLRQHHGLQDHR